MIKHWYFWLLALVLVVAIFLGPAARAQEGGQIPIAQFTCKDGICTTTEAQVQQIEHVIKLLVDKIRELQTKTGCT